MKKLFLVVTSIALVACQSPMPTQVELPKPKLVIPKDIQKYAFPRIVINGVSRKSQACRFDYNPVCGTFEINGEMVRQTFGNACIMGQQATIKPVSTAKGICQVYTPIKELPKPKLVAPKHAIPRIVVNKISVEPRVCKANYKPVCGTFEFNGEIVRQTFGNACAMSATIIKPISTADGACQEYTSVTKTKTAPRIVINEVPSKPIECTLEDAPICGTFEVNGEMVRQTFGNTCSISGALIKPVSTVHGACQ